MVYMHKVIKKQVHIFFKNKLVKLLKILYIKIFKTGEFKGTFVATHEKIEHFKNNHD